MDLNGLKEGLMAADFDVEQHASKLVQSDVNVNDYVASLVEAERELDLKLEEHVSAHHQDLLSQATGVERLEDQLLAVTNQSAALLASVERARARVNEPYESIRNQTVTLSRLQETCDILRRIIRIFQLGKKLQQQLDAGTSEITKAAQSLSEFHELWEPESDLLSGIDAVDAERRLFRHARTDVERDADAMLSSGMENKSQSQMGIALQVCFNLGILESKIDRLVSDSIAETRKSLVGGLDPKRIESNLANPAGAAAVPNPSQFRAQFWTNVENALDTVHSKCCEMLQLQKVLCKKRDQMGVTFDEALNRKQIVTHFWSEMLACLKDGLRKSASESSTVRQSLESEYPKLVRIFNDLWHRLCSASQSSMAADPSVNVQHPFRPEDASASRCFQEVLVHFERSYLSLSLSRLFDPVNLMFSNTSKAGQNLPTRSELQQALNVMSSELTIASKVDESLSLSVARNVVKTVKLMCNKCEQALVSDDETSQVVNFPTDDQRNNVDVVNCLHQFGLGVADLAAGGNTGHGELIGDSLCHVERLCRASLEPLVASVKDVIEAIVLTMHHEAALKSSNDNVDPEKPSPFMKELKTFVRRAAVDFLLPFECKSLVGEYLGCLVVETVDAFVLHASLLRPIGSAGRKRIAHDAGRLEAVLEPMTSASTGNDAKEAFRTVEALEEVLFCDPGDFESLGCLKDGRMKYSTALHFLFAAAPPEIRSPHESADWSVARYSKWLQDHPLEADRLQLIQGALESYVAATRMRREKSYAAPYPVMLRLLQTALNQ